MNLRQKMYCDLYEKCLEINNRIDDSLLTCFDELDESLRATLLIDNNVFNNDLFNELKSNVNGVYSDLKSYEQILAAKCQG